MSLKYTRLQSEVFTSNLKVALFREFLDWTYELLLFLLHVTENKQQYQTCAPPLFYPYNQSYLHFDNPEQYLLPQKVQ